MSLDDARQEVLDHLNLGQGGKDAVVGLKIGASSGAAVGAAIGAWFPGLPAITGAAGTLYGAAIGASVGFLHGLFTTDPAVTKRKAQEWLASTFRAQAALDAVFNTWPAEARKAFVNTPMYARLASAAVNPKRYLTDPLSIIDNPDVREAFREELRIATISPEHPEGIVFGDEAMRAAVKDRLAQKSAAVNAGLAKGAPSSGRALVVLGVLGVLGGASAYAARRMRRRDGRVKA